MGWGQDILTASCTAEPVPLHVEPGTLLGALAAHEDPAMLDSAARHETYGRYSVLSCRPLQVLTLKEGVLSDREGKTLATGGRAIWEALARAFGSVVLRAPPGGSCPPYLPGWIGYVGYEVGRHVEKLPGRAVRDTHLPDLRLAFYDCLLVYDALDRRWWLVRLDFDSPPPGAGRSAEALREIIAGGPNAPDPASAPVPCCPGEAQTNFTQEGYRRAIARCVEYIAAGDIFQVNLSQRFTVRRAPAPRAIYRELRRGNPASYAAYLSFRADGHDCAVLSSSPELFLRVRGDRVITRPIKGTRPRVGEQRADDAAASDLWNSPKDNAELAMIIDLLRNDLGRVCRYGSVRVAEPRCLETHPTVFHLVGTVEGQLRGGIGPADLLRATFPGGSITGAPKIRAMEIIDELEPCARGVYTGCIGIVGVDGASEWNIAIRTIVCEDGVALVQAGGGIVADSTPQGEYDETLDKARAMLQAIAMAGRYQPPM